MIPQPPIQEGVHFYFNEEGLLVFTASYHLARGYCCGNGCRHCPYNFVEVAEPKRAELLQDRKKINEKGHR